MKRRLLPLLLLLALLLAGCDTEPEPTETTQPTISITEPAGMTEPTTAPSALPFSLQLPAGWYSRSIVSYTQTDATLSIDGQETFTVTYTDNVPGAKAKDRELTTEGYTYFAEDGEHFFYYKFHQEVPWELIEILDRKIPDDRGDDVVFDYIILRLFRFESDLVQLQYTIDYCLYGSHLDCWMSLKATTYTNHRLGVSIDIPAETLRRYSCELCSRSYEFCLYTFENTRIERLYGNTYRMCTFAAYPNESTVPILYLDQGKCVQTTDTLYISINDWQSPVDVDGNPIYMTVSSWSGIPDYVKSWYTTKEVQQIVDSFTILDSNP